MPMKTLLAMLLGVSVAAQPARSPARGSIGQVEWIAGGWTGEGKGVTFEERWTRPAGGAMLAVSRTLKGDRMVAFEFLASSNAFGLVYVAQRGGRPPTDFVLT